MAVKYQVFVSSTYVDLVEERQAVSRAILDIGHIPAGMEMFPAVDMEQLAYIKKVIDECDYYVLIIGARYGSLDEGGISYTEREFDYAVESGKIVLVFLHSDIDQVPLGKTDKDDSKRAKLLSFMAKASTGRIIQKWDNPTALRANAIVSLQQAFSQTPQVGWVRANTVATSAAMADIIKYRDEIDALRSELDAAKGSLQAQFEDAADLNAKVTFNYTYYANHQQHEGSRELTYSDVMKCIAGTLNTPTTLAGAELALKAGLRDRHGASGSTMSLRTSQVQDALMHLVATGNVKMYNSMTMDKSQHVTAYQLTSLGIKTWKELSYVKNGAQ